MDANCQRAKQLTRKCNTKRVAAFLTATAFVIRCDECTLRMRHFERKGTGVDGQGRNGVAGAHDHGGHHKLRSYAGFLQLRNNWYESVKIVDLWTTLADRNVAQLFDVGVVR